MSQDFNLSLESVVCSFPFNTLLCRNKYKWVEKVPPTYVIFLYLLQITFRGMTVQIWCRVKLTKACLIKVIFIEWYSMLINVVTFSKRCVPWKYSVKMEDIDRYGFHMWHFTKWFNRYGLFLRMQLEYWSVQRKGHADIVN